MLRLSQGSIPCCLITGVFDVVGSYGKANIKEVWWRYMKGQHKSYLETIGDNYQVRCGGIGRRYPKLRLKEAKNK